MTNSPGEPLDEARQQARTRRLEAVWPVAVAHQLEANGYGILCHWGDGAARHAIAECLVPVREGEPCLEDAVLRIATTAAFQWGPHGSFRQYFVVGLDDRRIPFGAPNFVIEPKSAAGRRLLMAVLMRIADEGHWRARVRDIQPGLPVE